MTDMARTFRRIAHVANDPNVLSGRAVQEAFGRRWLMRSCVNVFGFRLEHVLRAIMDISAHAILLADRPHRAVRVTRVRTRREDRSSIVVSSSRKTRRVKGIDHAITASCLRAVPL